MKTVNCKSWQAEAPAHWQAEAPAPHWFFVGQALSPANQFLSHLDRVFKGVMPTEYRFAILPAPFPSRLGWETRFSASLDLPA
jgi:hypothetical protein